MSFLLFSSSSIVDLTSDSYSGDIKKEKLGFAILLGIKMKSLDFLESRLEIFLALR